MALLTNTAAQILSDTYGSLTAGQAAGYQAANAGGDSIPLIGKYTMITLKTAGTGSTVTLDSVQVSNFGQDNNITVTLAATDEQDFVIDCSDSRFDQVSGNVGSLNLSYSSVTTLTIKAKYIP